MKTHRAVLDGDYGTMLRPEWHQFQYRLRKLLVGGKYFKMTVTGEKYSIAWRRIAFLRLSQSRNHTTGSSVRFSAKAEKWTGKFGTFTPKKSRGASDSMRMSFNSGHTIAWGVHE
jgi:hypothetical protein